MVHQKASVRVFLLQSVQEKQPGLLHRQERALDKPWQKWDLVVPRFSLVPIRRYGNVLRQSSELEQCRQEDVCLSSLRSSEGQGDVAAIRGVGEALETMELVGSEYPSVPLSKVVEMGHEVQQLQGRSGGEEGTKK